MPLGTADEHKRIDYYNRRLSSMDKERSSFRSHWQDLSEYIQPRRGRFFVSDRNKGKKVHNNIINSAGTQALNVARSGMLAGTMSPSRPWFDLETPDPDMMENQEVKEWLSGVVRLMQAIFNASNLYSQASTLLEELLLFGTGCMLHVDDFDDVARFYTQSVGSYMIAQNNRMEVDTLVREFEWPVQMVVQEFGLENASTLVKNEWDRGNYDSWIKVRHIIEPNTESKARPMLATDQPFASVYYEPGNSSRDNSSILRESGFAEFPAYIPRWDVTGEDIYGTNCPGMTALGDVRGLQIEEKEKAKAIQKIVSPPLSGPPSLRDQPVNSLPGGLTIYSGVGPQTLSPIYQIQPQLGELRADMDAVTQRINSAFFVDMFLAITTMQGIQPRNELDILSRNEERLLQLGPVLERLHGEFLEKMIDRTFNQVARANLLPPIPDILEGQELRVKFISSLAIAQRAVVTADLDRVLAAVGGVAQVDPSAIKKLDGQQYVDEYARAIGVPPKVIRPDEEVADIEAEEAQQLANQRAMESLQAGASAAKDASQASTEGENMLSNMVNSQNE